MIRYLKHDEIDFEKWDRCVSAAPNGLIYAYSWYLDIVSPNWDALVEDDYQSVMPLTFNRKFTVYYLFPPFFVQQLGVFSIDKKISTEKAKLFFDLIPSRFKYIEINLNTENDFEIPGLKKLKNITYHLYLDKTYDELVTNYSNNVLRNIKKANKSGIEIIKGSEQVSNIVNIFRKNKGKEISNLKAKHFLMFEQLLNQTNARKSLSVYAACYDGIICAGIILFYSNNKYIFIFSAVNEFGKKIGAMHFLIDNFLKDVASAQNKNLILDFEGSNNLTLARFYKSFGSEEKHYFKIIRNNLPAAIKLLKNKKKFIKC